jgi:hypothetical protein
MFNWLTPNVQKGIALTFIFSWFLAQERFKWFWLALSNQVTLGTSGGSVGIIGTTVLPDLPGGQQPSDQPPEDQTPPTDELPPGEEPPAELPPSGENPLPLPGSELPSDLPFF